MRLSLAIVLLWAMGLAEPVMMSTRQDIIFFRMCVCVHEKWTSDLFYHACGRPVNMALFLISTIVPYPWEGSDSMGKLDGPPRLSFIILKIPFVRRYVFDFFSHMLTSLDIWDMLSLLSFEDRFCWNLHIRVN